METVEFKYGPKTLHLYYSASAMFDVQALNSGSSEEDPDILERIMQNTSDGVEMLCQVAGILAEAGELARRYLGYSKERIPTGDELMLILTPMQLLALKRAVVHAIDQGYRAGDDEDSESPDIDLGLMDLEKKTKL